MFTGSNTLLYTFSSYEAQAIKNSNQIRSGCDGSSFKPLMRQASTDKHLILSVSLVNGLRYGRYKNFEPATEARHNRGYLACRLDHFPLDEISGSNDLIVRPVDRIADQLDLLSRLVLHLGKHREDLDQ